MGDRVINEQPDRIVSHFYSKFIYCPILHSFSIPSHLFYPFSIFILQVVGVGVGATVSLLLPNRNIFLCRLHVGQLRVTGGAEVQHSSRSLLPSAATAECQRTGARIEYDHSNKCCESALAKLMKLHQISEGSDRK